MTVTSANVLLNRLQAKARLRHLQVLVKLAELRSLRRCAEALGLSQPAVTQLLADLERLVEIALFERHSRGVRLTPAGQELLPLARRMLAALAEGSEVLTALKQQGEGMVRIAAVTAAISGFLVRALPRFEQAHPRLQVQVRECDPEQCGLLLARGEVDLVLCRAPESEPAGARFTPLIMDRFVVACGNAHPLAGKRSVRWSVLARQRWLLSPVGSAARDRFDQMFTQAGLHPPASALITRVSALTWAMLDAQPLVTLVPFGVVRQLVDAGQLALIEPQPALHFVPLGTLMPTTGVTTAMQTFADFLGRFAASPECVP